MCGSHECNTEALYATKGYEVPRATWRGHAMASSHDALPIVEYRHLQKGKYEARRPKRGPPLSLACSLEDELRLQFDYPWGCIRTQTRTIDCRRLTNGLRDLSELVAVHVGVRKGKVRVIEEIEEPCAN